MLHCAPVVVTDRDRDARLDDELRRLAAAAGVAAPMLEVRTDTKRLALVRYSRDGVRLLVRPETLRLPTQVLRGILAHEVAHIARQHSSIRRRMGIASLAAIWATLLAGTIAMVIAILTAPRWLWPAPVAAALCMLILTRATQLVVVRRQEYEADRVAAKLVGSTEPLIAFLDWVSSHGGDQGTKVWDATHPSNAARRKALLGVQSSRP